MTTLFAYAAPIEGAQLATEHGSRRFVEIGIGPACAAMRLTRALASAPTTTLVVSFGVCGAYPSANDALALPVGALCAVASEVFADVGVETPTGFVTLAQLGLGVDEVLHADPRRSRALAERLRAPLVHGATVSTCSGTDTRAAAVHARTGAAIETMEGAAVALVCAQFAVPWVGLRAVSNRCGDRARGGFDIAGACATLASALRRLLALEEWA